jgi:hypothetical protein
VTPLPSSLHAALTGIARSRSAPHVLLRGSIPLSQWSNHARVPQDVDLLALQSIATLDLEELVHCVVDALQSFGCAITLVTHDVLWPNTEFYGVRLRFRAHDETIVQIDIGEGDPVLGRLDCLWLSPHDHLDMVGPLLSFSWKLHGLFEFGRGRWETKTLHDLWILTTEVLPSLGPNRDLQQELQTAIATAFWSHHHDVDILLPFLDEIDWGQGRKNRRQWRAQQRRHVNLPSLDVVLSAVRTSVEQPVRYLLEQVANKSMMLPSSLISDPGFVSPVIRVQSADELRGLLARGDSKIECLWVAWPKVTSSVPSELGQTIVRNIAADFGFIDVETRSVDHDWTALKFEPRVP